MPRRTGHYKTGRFKPRNPQKYLGDPTQIVYRSFWEFNFMRALGGDAAVTGWSSESVVVPYRSPKDGRIHRYFIDFLVKKGGKTSLVEIKPMSQCAPPKTRRKTEKYLNEVLTYGVNMAKWEAADAYAKSKGWEFVVLTEKDPNVSTWKRRV